MTIKKAYLLLTLFVVTTICTAQTWTPTIPYIPAIRQFAHDNIDATQQRILVNNSKRDAVFLVCDNVDVNLYSTYILKNKIDELQYFVETNKTVAEADKYKWLRGINDVLTDFETNVKINGFATINFANLINGFEQAMYLQIANQSIKNVIDENVPEVGAILIKNFALQNNVGIDESKLILISKLCKQSPESTLKILTQYPNLPNADSLIVDFAYLYPQELYNYAASNTPIGVRIKNSNEPTVKLIAQMANSNNGRFLFPFLDAILAKIFTVNDVTSTIDNDEAYYKLLVKIQNSCELEKQQGKKMLSMDALTDKLKAKALEIYITPINALHDENNLAIRFDKIKNLTPLELYFLTIMGEEELYTSSFISGVYPKMIAGLGTIKSDSLLRLAHFGYYRKFIKMCAAFNMLEDYLSKMDKGVAENLMKSFANNLEDYWSLEEAVDVADSYSSIADKSIKKIISDEVKNNVIKQTNNDNKKGKVIYGLLNQILSSFDSAVNTDVANLYHIPSIYQLNNNSLKNDKGRIYVQQFFYGDKDGKEIFNGFVNNFRSNGWHIINKPNWVEVNSSNSYTPITIFANKPLNEDEGLDDAAQKYLYNYLDSLNIYPTIVIHRGHSYYVKTSIKQITSYAKLVLLGSCGGYHSLAKVLSISPQTQIIASKQIGTGKINSALIELIFENLKQGKDLNWFSIWKNLETKFANNKEMKERFDDYIPPQKNLGAIFIMSYYKAMENSK